MNEEELKALAWKIGLIRALEVIATSMKQFIDSQPGGLKGLLHEVNTNTKIPYTDLKQELENKYCSYLLSGDYDTQGIHVIDPCHLIPLFQMSAKRGGCATTQWFKNLKRLRNEFVHEYLFATQEHGNTMDFKRYKRMLKELCEVCKYLDRKHTELRKTKDCYLLCTKADNKMTELTRRFVTDTHAPFTARFTIDQSAGIYEIARAIHFFSHAVVQNMKQIAVKNGQSNLSISSFNELVLKLWDTKFDTRKEKGKEENEEGKKGKGKGEERKMLHKFLPKENLEAIKKSYEDINNDKSCCDPLFIDYVVLAIIETSQNTENNGLNSECDKACEKFANIRNDLVHRDMYQLSERTWREHFVRKYEDLERTILWSATSTTIDLLDSWYGNDQDKLPMVLKQLQKLINLQKQS